MMDSTFIVPPVAKESMIHEEREMQVMNMGQYAHGNQPIQHMIYLYNYVAQPWKAQYWLRQVMDKLYSANPAATVATKTTARHRPGMCSRLWASTPFAQAATSMCWAHPTLRT